MYIINNGTFLMGVFNNGSFISEKLPFGNSHCRHLFQKLNIQQSQLDIKFLYQHYRMVDFHWKFLNRIFLLP